MIEKGPLKKAVGSLLRASGYQKRGQTWHKVGDEVVAAVELQKSQYSDFYYVNVAFELRALSGDELMPTHKSHICLRAERLLPDDVDKIDSLFRLDNAELTSDEQISAISQFFIEKLIPRCDRLLEMKNIRAEYKNGGFRKASIRKVAAQFLMEQ